MPAPPAADAVERRDRLAALRTLAGHQEAESARRLAERVRALAQEEQRLRQIHGYLQEYQQRTAQAAGVTTVASVLGARRFLGRLQAAVGEQQGTVENHRRQVEQHTTQWQAARARSLALQRLAERRAAAARQKADGREQRRLDEIAIAGARARRT